MSSTHVGYWQHPLAPKGATKTPFQTSIEPGVLPQHLNFNSVYNLVVVAIHLTHIRCHYKLQVELFIPMVEVAINR